MSKPPQIPAPENGKLEFVLMPKASADLGTAIAEEVKAWFRDKIGTKFLYHDEWQEVAKIANEVINASLSASRTTPKSEIRNPHFP